MHYQFKVNYLSFLLHLMVTSLLIFSTVVQRAWAEDSVSLHRDIGAPFIGCPTIDIYSFYSGPQGEVMYQKGSGTWITWNGSKPYILTVAHLVSGADRLVGVCQNTAYELNLKGESTIDDVALLSSTSGPSAGFFKLQDGMTAKFPTSDREGETANKSVYINSSVFKNLTIQQSVYKHYHTSNNWPAIDTKNGVILLNTFNGSQISQGLWENTNLLYPNRQVSYLGGDSAYYMSFGIVPGMSGSPVYTVEEGKPYLQGLVSKTYRDMPWTALVPMPTILRKLKDFFQNSDISAKDFNLTFQPNWEKGKIESVLSLGSSNRYVEICESEMKMSADALVLRARPTPGYASGTLDRPNTDLTGQIVGHPGQLKKYDSTNGKSIPKPVKDIIDKKILERLKSNKLGRGGDWGEGGGDLSTKDYFHTATWNEARYSPKNVCHSRGLKSSSGKKFVAFKYGSSITPISSFESIFPALIAQKAVDHDFLEKSGVESGSKTYRDYFCRLNGKDSEKIFVTNIGNGKLNFYNGNFSTKDSRPYFPFDFSCNSNQSEWNGHFEYHELKIKISSNLDKSIIELSLGKCQKTVEVDDSILTDGIVAVESDLFNVEISHQMNGTKKSLKWRATSFNKSCVESVSRFSDAHISNELIFN